MQTDLRRQVASLTGDEIAGMFTAGCTVSGMGVNSVSFDDPDEGDLFVFSGDDLLTAHYDLIDLDWHEVAERSVLDARRGLVIAQVVALEDLVDEFILYLADEADQDAFMAQLDREMIGQRLTRLKGCLEAADMMDDRTLGLLEDLSKVVRRRNELAHGTIHVRPVGGHLVLPPTGDVDLEWVITSRRSDERKRITMRMLREDLEEAIGTFMAILSYGEWFVEHAPRPVHFVGGRYLSAPGSDIS